MIHKALQFALELGAILAFDFFMAWLILNWAGWW